MRERGSSEDHQRPQFPIEILPTAPHCPQSANSGGSTRLAVQILTHSAMKKFIVGKHSQLIQYALHNVMLNLALNIFVCSHSQIPRSVDLPVTGRPSGHWSQRRTQMLPLSSPGNQTQRPHPLPCKTTNIKHLFIIRHNSILCHCLCYVATYTT